MVIGLALWLYGYLAVGHASFVDWKQLTPTWISDYVPNLEAEIGVALMLLSTVLTWPNKRPANLSA
jgi:hypothetical protein